MAEFRIEVLSPDNPKQVEEARELFFEYAEWLSPIVRITTIHRDIAALPEPFVPPSGRLLLACGDDGVACGCIGVRRFSDTECELKRLYVRPSCRTSGIGRALFSAALDAARELGYREALISTIPSHMDTANRMYEQYGFVPTDNFEGHSHDDVEMRYLRFDLTAEKDAGPQRS
jgi:GNAT superfamily N-acetyltransferase